MDPDEHHQTSRTLRLLAVALLALLALWIASGDEAPAEPGAPTASSGR
ncbi:MAG: hypothetical protein MUF03_06750 [Rubrivivax sp.]|jgi:hypothetical protein|nr:hypothetical protein [Rubrivivax sp.]